MSALTLLFIRHAEKPDENWPGPGLTVDGVEDKKSLVIRGWQRAGAWGALFGGGSDNKGLGGPQYPAPAVIYAADPQAEGNAVDDPSKRPFETVIPLAAKLGLDTVVKFAVGNEDKLVAALLKLSGVVLVAWEHKAIAEKIVPLIPVKSGTPPQKWPGDRFDAVLRFDRKDGDDKFDYRMLLPCLMSGDSNQPF